MPLKPPEQGAHGTPMGAQSSGQFSGEKVVPHFVPKTCLSFPHSPIPPRATLAPLYSWDNTREFQSGSRGIPLLWISSLSAPCVGPTQPALPRTQPHGEAGQCTAQGDRPSYVLSSQPGPPKALFTPESLEKMTLGGRHPKIPHKEQKTLS